MKSNKLIMVLLSVLLLSSIVLPVIAANQSSVSWLSPVEIKTTGNGLVFGKGANKITVEVNVAVPQGQDYITKKWNPVKQSHSKTSSSRTENVKDSGFEMDFYIVKDTNEIKFDLYASQEITVSMKVSGVSRGLYIWKQGKLSLNLFDVFVFADNFNYDETTQTIYFTMTAGERIDPLLTYNEVAGTYVYDAIADDAPGVVLPATYADNVTLHVPGLYDTSGLTLQDWLLYTQGGYTVVDADTVSYEWILENLREETSPGLTDGHTNIAGTEHVIYDDLNTSWVPRTTTTLDISNTEFVKGTSALNITWGNNNFAYFDNNTGGIDITPFDFISFWYKGSNSGGNLRFILTSDAAVGIYTNSITFQYADTFTDWRRFVVPINSFVFGGSVDLTSIQKIRFGTFSSNLNNEIHYLDRLVFDNTMWTPSEFYIGDNVTSIEVYNLDSTGADPRILFEWDVNGTTDGSIYPGNLRNLEDEWLGSIAKQNATDWTIKANTTLPAGVRGQYLINTTVQLPSGADRLCLPADFVNNKLQDWNEEQTISSGNPWLGDPIALGSDLNVRSNKLGYTNINSGITVNLRRISYASGWSNIFPTAQSAFNWVHDTGADTYSYEFYVDNDNAAAQNATIEVGIPDLADIATYTLSYWNGTAFVEFMDFASGSITQPKSINQTSLDAAMYLEGVRTETKAIVNATAGLADIGSITYSNNYGIMQRFGFVIELGASDGDPAAPDGADEILLRFTMTYVNDGEATYEFSGGDSDQYWGLDNLDNSAIELFDASAGAESPYLILLTANKVDALWITANAAQEITALEFNATGNYKVLTDTALGTETTTAPTGETIQLTADRWQYYKNIAQFDRGERTDVELGEGDSGFAWTYTSYAGADQKVAFKVPLAPWQNATEVDVDSGRSQMRLRAVVNYATPSTWSYTMDLTSNTDANFVLTLLCDFYEDSYNIGPTLPMKNATVTFTDPRTSTPYNFTYTSDAGATAEERNDVDHITINGVTVQSKVVPVGTVTAGAGAYQNITVYLGEPNNPVVHSVANGNLTASTYDYDVKELTVGMNRDTGQSTLIVDVGGLGNPSNVKGTSNWSYNATTGLVTLTINHASPKTVRIYWQNLSYQAIEGLGLMWTIFPLVVLMYVIEAKKRDLVGNNIVVYALVFAVAALILVAIRLTGA